MVTADQLVAHAVGDYIIQSHWMATEKTKRSVAAGVHAVTYALPFLLLKPSLLALAVIIGTHFVIDRWRLAKWVVGFKNKMLCPPTAVPRLTPTGSPWETPDYLAVWLLIIADNVLHVLINAAALCWL